MTGFSQILAVSALLCLVSPPGRAEEPVAPEATLRIQTRVYNTAKVRPAVLSTALIEASEIFRRIGVEIEMGGWFQPSAPWFLSVMPADHSPDLSHSSSPFWAKPPGLCSNLRGGRGAGNDLF
jgi:hypothetical protein